MRTDSKSVWLGLVALAILGAGCGRGKERFTPSEQLARNSLAAALDAWKAGSPPGTITCQSPQVQVADTERQPGQRLLDYQILSEVASASGRAYVVKLQFAEPAAEQRARYIVIGIDPIWVFRKEDFDRLQHWEHPMPDPSAPPEETELTEIPSQL
jgi:hypothetical protein